MRRGQFFFIFICVINCFCIIGQQIKPTIYLIPGQGSDYRIFNNLKINKDYTTKHIYYTIPNEGANLKDFAVELSSQIDTNKRFILIGVSLGGMIATEMGDFLNPDKIILLSSAKCRDELPVRYKIQKKIKLHKLLSENLTKKGAQIVQPIVEPDRNKEKETFKSMLKDKDPVFLKRTVEMIVNWDKINYREDIIHIHGEKDRTIPIRNVTADYVVKNGSHMMTLTKGGEISDIINNILSD